MINYTLKEADGVFTVASVILRPENTDSFALQSAIDECAANGGGTVWLEAGEYILSEPVTIRTAVIVSGCCDPTKHKDGNTVLLCKYGRGEPENEAQFLLSACSGLKNCVVCYPDNTIENAVPYPPTVRQRGVDSLNIENAVFVNPWKAIQCGPDPNELHFIKNVRMTPLDTGVYMDMTTDIGRLMGVHVGPESYADYFGTDEELVTEYMLKNVTGIFMARSDWEYAYDISCKGCRTGLLITSAADSGPNAQISNLRLENCDTAICAADSNPFGIAISDSVIICRDNSCAVRTEVSFKNIIQFCGVDFINEGNTETAVLQLGSSQLSFADCTFSGFGSSDFAIVSKGGGVSFAQCDFSGAKKHFMFSDGENRFGGAQILGCTFDNELCIDSESMSADKIKFSDENRGFPKASRGGHKPYPYSAQANKGILFPVDKAFGNGKDDASKAIQDALDKAGAEGGGIVYVPAGKYVCASPLHIPSGVELRGIAEMPFHTMGGGSVLSTDWGRGDENAEPFVTVSENAGIRGVVFHNISQSPTDPVPYPFAVRTLGRKCYAVNVVFANMWQALDMWSYPSDGHYVSYISGAPFKCGVRLGSNDGEGWVENIQFNPHYWFRSNLPNAPKETSWNEFWFHQMRMLEAVKFGYNKNEHLLGTFVFAATHGLDFVRQDGKGTTGKFIGHGTDSGQTALFLGGADRLELINTQLVNIMAEGRRSYIYSAPVCEKEKCGEYFVYNTLMWGDPHYAAIFDGGKVFIEQMNIVNPGKTAVTVNGGDITMSQVFFRNAPVVCEVNGGYADFYSPVTSENKKIKNDEAFGNMVCCGGKLDVEFPMIK